MRRWIKVLVFSSFLAPGTWLLAGCGFHLRAPVALPEAMARTQLRGVEPRSELANEIRGVLGEAGAQVVDAGETAGVVLEISGARFERRVASVNDLGKASQYELRFTLNGSLREPGGEVLVEPRRASVVRSLNAGGSTALGTVSEEDLLRREMQRDAVRQLVRQLRTALEHRAAQ